MTQTAMQMLLSQMTGETDTDVLAAYLSLAETKILRRLYPFRSDITVLPEQYTTNQVDIAAYLINKRGAEGQTSHNENGIDRKYGSADVPVEYFRGIVPYADVVGGVSNESP